MSFAPAWSGPTGHASIQEQRERWERKHNLTAVELLQTERRYCEQLELVTTVGLPATTPSVTTDLNQSSHRSEKDSHLYGDSHKPSHLYGYCTALGLEHSITSSLLSSVLCETFDGQGNLEERH